MEGGFGTVDRAVASDTKELGFESKFNGYCERFTDKDDHFEKRSFFKNKSRARHEGRM